MCLEKAALEIYKTFVKKAKSLAKYVTESGMKPNLAFGYFNHYKYYYSYGGIILIPSSVLILEGQELTSKTKNHKVYYIYIYIYTIYIDIITRKENIRESPTNPK